jgi:hypothetical protein
MARIRTIKPEFPQSESVGRLSRDARLLFIQLWTAVDDYGRARAAPKLLSGLLYPYDDDAPSLIGTWLAELHAAGFIRLYQAEGSQYLDIPTWGKHQRIDNAGKSNIPPYEEPSRGDEESTRREPPRTAASDGEPPLDLGKDLGEEKDLGESANADASRDRPKEKRSKRRPETPIPADHRTSEGNRKRAHELGFSPVEIDRESEKFRAHAQANDRRCRDWDAAERQWFLSAAGYAKKQPRPPATDGTAPIDWDQILATFKQFGRWPSSGYGGQPGMVSCRVPAETLRKHGYDPPSAVAVA